jgi:hypothetical protein
MAARRQNGWKAVWTSIPAVVKQITALLTAVAALLGSLAALGIFGGDGNKGGSEGASGSTAGKAPTAALPVVVRFEGSDPRYAERGFFTPQGNIVSTQHALASTYMVAWTGEGRAQEARVRLLRRGGPDLPGAVLFELAREQPPRRDYGTRDARSLHKGEPVTAFLGTTQSTPGKVLDKAAQVAVPGYGTLSNLVLTTSLGRQSEGGAPLLDNRKQVIGMLFAGSENQTVSLRIEDIRAEFPDAFP